MNMPLVLYRWLDEKQVRSLLDGDLMEPTWTHLAPDTGRLEKGVSFGEDGWSWFDGSDQYVALVAIATEGLPPDLRPVKLDGHMAFNATNKHRLALRQARSTQDPDEKAALRRKAADIASCLAEAHRGGTAEPDEWFLRGRVDTRGRILALVFKDGSHDLRRILVAREADGSLDFPVRQISPYAWQPKDLEAAIREALEDLIPEATKPTSLGM